MIVDADPNVALQWSDAAVDCTAALAIDGGYVKAYMRRASAYEQSDDLERALADYKKVLFCHKSAGSQTLGVQPHTD